MFPLVDGYWVFQVGEAPLASGSRRHRLAEEPNGQTLDVQLGCPHVQATSHAPPGGLLSRLAGCRPGLSWWSLIARGSRRGHRLPCRGPLVTEKVAENVEIAFRGVLVSVVSRIVQVDEPGVG